MSNPNWNGRSDNWTLTPSDWSTGTEPGPGDNVTIASGDPQITSNVGTVASVTDNSDLSLAGGTLATTGGFTNTGTIYVDSFSGAGGGGSSLTIGGLLTNSGTVDIGDPYVDQSKPSTVTVNALSNSGTINLSSSGSTYLSSLVVQGSAGFGTAGSLNGNVNLSNDTAIIFAGGQITDIAASSELTLGSTDSIIADASASAPTSNSALTGLATIEGSLNIFGGSLISTTGGISISNTGSINVDLAFGAGGGGSSLTIDGLLTNAGTIDIGDPYVDQSKISTVTVNALSNSGTINVESMGSTYLSSLVVQGAAGVLTGQVNLTNDTLLEFASGEINSIAASSELTLNGADAYVADKGTLTSNSALTGLNTVTGSLNLQNGASISPTGALTNTGSIYLENSASLSTTGALTNSGLLAVDAYYGEGGSSLSIGGVLTNSGTVNIGNNSVPAAATTVTAKGLSNTGTVNIASTSASVPATMIVNGTAENAGSISINTYGALQVQGEYEQTAAGSLTLEVQGTSAGQFSTVATTGSVDLLGGTLYANILGLTLAAGDTFNLLTFTPGELAGIFNALSTEGDTGDGTSVNLGNGLTAGLVYNDALGNVQLDVIATPTSTADTWTAGAGNWSAAADWSGGAPNFASDVTIGSLSTANVTLSADATINSLTLDASDTLTTGSGTDLSVGATLALSSGATLTVGGEAFFCGATTNAGSIVAAGTLLDLRGAVSGAGALTLDAGATLELGGADAETVNFAGASATLKLDDPAAFTGVLNGLIVGDAIDLAGIDVTNAVVSGSVLTVTEANNSTLSFNLSNFPGGAGFSVKSDGAGGSTLIVIPPSTNVTFDSINGNDVINYAQAHAAGGVALSGTVTGLAVGATFNLSVVDGTFSKTYVATVGTGGTWTATMPSADAITLGNGAAAFTATVNSATTATQNVTVAEALPVLTISKIDGNDVINSAEAAAGVPISGSSTGLASGATFSITLTDGSFSKTYTAMVSDTGAWSANVSATDATSLADGSATLSAQATDAYGNPTNVAADRVTVQETLPTLSISAVDSNNIINNAEAAAGVTISGASAGLASGATFAVTVTDGTSSNNYSATVGANGAWTATIPSSAATTLANGTASLSAQATDAYGNPTNVATDSVTVQGNLPPPTISGTVQGQTTASEAQVAPFAGVSIGDANAGATETLTIAISGAGGVLTGAGPLANGVYTLSGTAAEVTSELDALIFTPTAGASGTDSTSALTLTDTSSATLIPAVATTGVIDIDPSSVVLEYIPPPSTNINIIPTEDGGDDDGDPHLLTFDGVHYDLQQVGEFVLTKSTAPGDNFQIQIRTVPWYSGATVAVTTQVAIALGADDVDIDLTRPDTLEVNGAAVTLTASNNVDTLAGGSVTLISPNTYEIRSIHGETAIVSNEGSYLSVTKVLLGANFPAGDVVGLLGTDTGNPANDFQTANGTILQQPMSLSTLYQTFAASWRVTQAESLLSYGPGQTTATFTDLNFPGDAVTLAQLPTSVVLAAAAAVAAAGVTDPTLRDDAIYDYALTNDPSFIAGALTEQQEGVTTPLQLSPVDASTTLGLGVTAPNSTVTEATSGSTSVSFTVYSTAAVTSDTVVDYAVVAAGAGFLGATSFGGALPSGQVTIAAGQASATITIAVPSAALGAATSERLRLQISDTSATPVIAPTADVVLANATPTEGTDAIAAFAELSGGGALTHSGNAYTLDLGTVTQGATAPTIDLAIANDAATGANDLGGSFALSGDGGFTVSGAQTFGGLGAGDIQAGIDVALDAANVGAHSETITFAPTQANASGFEGSLTDISLTITSDVTGPPVVLANESVSGTTTSTSDTISETATAEGAPGNSIASVVVYDGTTKLGYATLAGGVWSLAVNGLGLGSHDFSTVTTDAAGNVTTTALAPVNIIPTPPTVSASESLSGLTNLNVDTITETATAATGLTIAGVEVFDNGKDLGPATYSATTGLWTFNTATLADGVHDLSTVTTDTAGNATTTALSPVDVATKGPAVTASESVSGITDKTTDTITETATAEPVGSNAIKSVEVYDGTTALGAAPLASGIWSFTTTTLADGVHDLSTVTTDTAGNATTATLTPVDVATQKPAVTASESVSGSTTQTSDLITVTATAEAVTGDSIASVLVYDGTTGLGAAVLSSGAYSYTASNLALGAHDFSVVATDAAGNSATATLAPVTVISSVTPPTVSASESLSGLTNLTSDTITETATAAAGLTIAGVEVFDNGKDQGAATFSAATGLWSFTTGTLADGANNFTTVTTDSADNQRTTTLAAVDVATKGPTVKASESVSGLTNQTKDVITETATAEAVTGDAIKSVEVYDGTTALGAATLSNGTWTFTTATLADGVHDLSTVTTDAAGNVTTTTLAPVDVATKGPTVKASESISGLTNQSKDSITETATAEAVGTNAIKSVEVYDGTKALGAAILSNGAWTFTTATLADGVHDLSTVTTDAAGNVTTTTLAPVDVATKGPTVKASESISGLTDKNVDTVTETATAEAVGVNAIKSVEVFDGTAALGAATLVNGTWTYTTPTLADGVHDLSTVTTDAAGKVATTTLAPVDIATKGPTVTASESNSGLTNQSKDTITETATAEAVGTNAIKSVEVYDGTKALGAATLSGGVWSFTASNLAYGVHTFSTVTTDAAGNVTTTALAADNVEPPPPTVTIALQNDSSKGHDVTNDDTLTGAGDDNAIVHFTIDGVAVSQTVTANASGAWIFTPTNLSQGPHTLAANETNGGGTGTASIAFTYDTVIPTVTIATASGHVANTAETIDGSGEAGTTIQLYDGSSRLGGTVTVGADGLWSDVVKLSSVGANSITAQDRDIANNVGVSAVTTLTLDNQIVGEAGQFTITGTSGADHITVGAGNVVVDTLGGGDTVTLTSAGRANQFHVIVGGGGSDTLDLSQTSGGAAVNLAQDTATGAQIGTNFVFNFDNIIGGGGAETLSGVNGGGFIQAGSGNDLITGGAGADTFEFLSAIGNDTISNFVVSGANHGVVDFDQALFANWGAVNAALTNTSAGAEIVLNSAETITFAGVTAAQLQANHASAFKFV